MGEPDGVFAVSGPGPAGHGGRPELASSWVDLLDVAAEQRVLLVDPGHRRAESLLRERTAHVTWCAGRADPGSGGPLDLVCVDGVRLRAAERAALRHRLVPGGRWVEIVDNPGSPLRLADRVRGKEVGPVARALPGRLLGRLRGHGLEVDQLFVLLRSSVQPVTAFDVLSSTGARATVDASRDHVTGSRLRLLDLMARSPWRVAAALAPAWLVVAVAPGARPQPPGAARITAKVGNRDSVELKVVRGDPPVELEKIYALSLPDAELAALRELAEVGFDLAPRVLAVPSPRSVRFSWMPGRSLGPASLDDDALVAWTARAARVLSHLQAATRRPDGTVLVHGDFWLGNLLAVGDEVSAVIDWTTAHRGDPAVDRDFLLASLGDRLSATPGLADRLARAIDPARSDEKERRPGAK